MSTLHGSDHAIDVTGDFALETGNGSAHPDTAASICADTIVGFDHPAAESPMATVDLVGTQRG
ncbi:hypothetical protein [Mycolicibacterium fortuitum]|uniref:hypothetical protein n=1 Tax=Mycolicibacterium fortuitum TaxID=1766 RepID=UPI0007EB2D70|nr:hypothetical protein [Mycolicibacterium fortuitum]MDV7195554.1 hypothetical protein [Mycolicibacterium fortuitum]NOQ62666.1 hypothetical protein [Mycolicibacterium fortuitum]OBB49097.1 hypothetical protein A5754_31695 [Mycolicibacterium fortuitum]OBB81075.1 hypothetical protein A5755_00275 [Mycolicibacterium fortuitum]OBF69694.1 hypothetical protein A5751_32320 [Mycolicibacterium fortuitum]